MSDYWYENRDRLNPGDVCILEDGSTIKLDFRVPGDETDWYVLDLNIGENHCSWVMYGRRIHPGDIKKGPQW